MPGKPRKRCLICGKIFAIEAPSGSDLEVAFLEEVPSKTPSFCPLCEAKIKKEAKDTQKDFKPM